MLWSILIAGIPERYHTVHKLLLSLLETQGVAKMADVELLYLMDNRRRTVGAKRNDLLRAAQGEYVCFIDDDDEVAFDYVRRIYAAIQAGRKAEVKPDVICFRQHAHIGTTGVIHDCTYSLAHWKNREPEKRRQLAQGSQPNVALWTGPPAHTMVWRRELATSAVFPEQQFGEDVAWVDSVCERAVSEVQLDGEPLYHYHFDPERTATR